MFKPNFEAKPLGWGVVDVEKAILEVARETGSAGRGFDNAKFIDSVLEGLSAKTGKPGAEVTPLGDLAYSKLLGKLDRGELIRAIKTLSRKGFTRVINGEEFVENPSVERSSLLTTLANIPTVWGDAMDYGRKEVQG